MKCYYVYILTNKKHSMFYVGFTDDIQRRTTEHKNKVFDGFTKRYDVDVLVYYECHLTIEEAMLREKRLKRWRRDWKIRLIEEKNPLWQDLSNNFKRKLTPMEKIEALFERRETNRKI